MAKGPESAMTLCDTGPLISLVSADDQHHRRCVLALSKLHLPLITTWPCLAEAMYLLFRDGGHDAQERLWDFIENGLLILHAHSEGEIENMRALMRKYANVSMDFADASLVATAMTRRDRLIFTLDSDFHIYRLPNGNSFKIFPN